MSFILAPRVPHPRLEVVRNLTPFPHFQCDKMAPGRRFHDTVVVKGMFELKSGTLAMMDNEPIIALADTYWPSSDPSRSSVKTAGDVVVGKPSTDLLITGSARSASPARAWDVAVAVRGSDGTAISHDLRVTGPRRWEHRSLRGWTLSEAEPTNEVPIRYELAYGGAYYDPRQENGLPRGWVTHEPNPCGKGFTDTDTLDKDETYPAPQWELPETPVSDINRDVPIAGLAPIARFWKSRARFAGTYDDGWLARTRKELGEQQLVPDYAPDFDARFFQCAHPAMIARKHLRGDEQIGLRGLMPSGGDFLTRLPGMSVVASLGTGPDEWNDLALPLDTVHFDLERARVYLCWRLSLDQSRDVRAAILRVVFL